MMHDDPLSQGPSQGLVGNDPSVSNDTIWLCSIIEQLHEYVSDIETHRIAMRVGSNGVRGIFHEIDDVI